jgi:hypothetical protein
MKSPRYLITSYILAIGYIILAFAIYDWVFHMVPYIKPNKRIFLDSFVCIYLLLLGLLLLLSSVGISLNKSYGYKLYRVTFWYGIIVSLVGSLGGAIFILEDIILGTIQIVSVTMLLYLPTAIIYLKKRKNFLLIK